SVVYLGDNKLQYSTSLSIDGGATWRDIHLDGPVVQHEDNRGPGFDALGRYSIGDDGGVWRYDRRTHSWADLNSNLATVQLQTIALHPTNPEVVYGGGVDNGLNRRRGDGFTWMGLRIGDTGSVRIDPQHPNIIYSQVIGEILARSRDGGHTFAPADSGIEPF